MKNYLLKAVKNQKDLEEWVVMTLDFNKSLNVS